MGVPEVGVSEEEVCCNIGASCEGEVYSSEVQALNFRENRHEAFILLKLFLPVLASKQGNVIWLVRIYICVQKKL